MTSVEYLIKLIGNKHSGAKLYFNANKDLIEKANKLHKEQIMNAYKCDIFPCSDEDAEQYYNETYKPTS